MIKRVLIIVVIITGLGLGINYFLQNKNDVNVNSKYSNCELGDLVGEDVERTVYKNFDIDYHSEDFKKSQVEVLAQKCIDEGVKNQYQMDCCMRTKMFPDE